MNIPMRGSRNNLETWACIGHADQRSKRERRGGPPTLSYIVSLLSATGKSAWGCKVGSLFDIPGTPNVLLLASRLPVSNPVHVSNSIFNNLAVTHL